MTVPRHVASTKKPGALLERRRAPSGQENGGIPASVDQGALIEIVPPAARRTLWEQGAARDPFTLIMEDFMDRIEKPSPVRPSEFANEGEISRTDPALGDTPPGREDHLGFAEAAAVAVSEIKRPIGARPRSEITGRHDPGSGANETIDGLTDTEEELRRAAEDTPTGGMDPDEDLPVFDRADAPPRI